MILASRGRRCGCEEILFLDETFDFVLVVVGRAIVGLRRSARETVGSRVLGSRNMDELEGEKEDASDPAVDRRVGLKVGAVEHAFDVRGIDFDEELWEADEKNAIVVECAKETIKFKLGLRVVLLRSRPCARAEAGDIATIVGTKLRQYRTIAVNRRIDGEVDRTTTVKVEGTDSARSSDSVFDHILRASLVGSEVELSVFVQELVDGVGDASEIGDESA